VSERAPVRVEADGPEGRFAALVFLPEREYSAPLPLLLFGHGAHLSKDDPIMQVLARGLTGVPAAVVLMDCPGHGERRPPDQDDDAFDRSVRRRMADPASHDQLAAEWIAIAAAARAAVPDASGPTGYAGFSMGSLFGLSMVHRLDDVRAAFFALGGTVYEDRPGADVINQLVLDGAAKLGEREVLMANMTRDQSFPIAGAIEVLEAIPGPKRMCVWTGLHEDIPPEAIGQGIRFFRRTLRA
jgi:pimeloyl-ACP methyl ester carboxylesterase